MMLQTRGFRHAETRRKRDLTVNSIAWVIALPFIMPWIAQGHFEAALRMLATLATLWLARHAARECAGAWVQDVEYLGSLAVVVLAVLFVLGGIWL